MKTCQGQLQTCSETLLKILMYYEVDIKLLVFILYLLLTHELVIYLF